MKPFESDEGKFAVPGEEKDAGKSYAQALLVPAPVWGSGR